MVKNDLILFHDAWCHLPYHRAKIHQNHIIIDFLEMDNHLQNGDYTLEYYLFVCGCEYTHMWLYEVWAICLVLVVVNLIGSEDKTSVCAV